MWAYVLDVLIDRLIDGPFDRLREWWRRRERRKAWDRAYGKGPHAGF